MSTPLADVLYEAGLRGKLRANVGAIAGDTTDLVGKITEVGWIIVSNINGMSAKRIFALYVILTRYGFELPTPNIKR